MNLRTVKSGAALLIVVASCIAGCGGGGGDSGGSVVATSTSNNGNINEAAGGAASATGTDSFFGQVKALAANAVDDAEPTSVAALTPSTPEDTEVLPII